MAHSTAVINIVGLSASLVGEHTPRLSAFAGAGRTQRLRPVLPAVTCSVQSSMLTGLPPREHGIVGNGWYDRTQCEVQFWKQSNRLVGGEKVWETARRRDPSFTCLNMFWWYNMYSSADWSVTPRPQYRADGQKIPDCYSHPAELRDLLQRQLGPFPLFSFWGPGASIESSRWIARATQLAWERHQPTLTLVYLPHLDYALQKVGPNHASIPGELRAIDAAAGELLDFFTQRDVRVMLLSEYGIEPVDDAVHINRVLREAGWLAVREENGRELLDAGASRAFAVADHQVAHVYVNDEALLTEVRGACERTQGVAEVLDRAAQREAGIDHARAGELVLVSEARRWFSYDYWLDDRRAPDFARTVDIHRKPGYDPLELFIDPAIALPKARLAWKLLRKKLGQRTLFDVIPLDTRLVRGSHGRVDQAPEHQPVLITQHGASDADELRCTAVRDVMLSHLQD
ncbi:MAG: alkaline phosphatase family protein [Phycisphaerales bacterium]|nr:alkaline phosphatase family protein [Phycisphaerales bacterium]